MSEELCELGVVGLTALGQSLAAHHASTRVRVCIGDEDPSFVPQVADEYRSQMEPGEEDEHHDNREHHQQEYPPSSSSSSSHPPRASRCLIASKSMGELVARLKRPRRIIIFGTHNDDAKFEEMWNRLGPNLERGDTILRWGKEEEEGGSGGGGDNGDDDDMNDVQFYNDSIVGKLSKSQARSEGIHLLEMIRLDRDRISQAAEKGELNAVSLGGEDDDGIPLPPAFMAGGPREGYDEMEAYVSCPPFASVGHVGNDASCAHYAHMILRTIENGVTQTYAEAFDVLTRAAGHEPPDAGRAMKKWIDEGGKMSSSLLTATSKIFYKRDHVTKRGFVVDHIRDTADIRPVDTWMTLEATRLGMPAPSVNAALDARFLSVLREEREQASLILRAPDIHDTPSVMKDQISEDLQNAMCCACLCVYSECLSILSAASEAESWDVDLGECVRLWNLPGSFLESKLLEKIGAALAYLKSEGGGRLKNLLVLPAIASELQELHMSWRRIVALSYASAIPLPTLSASLTYYDSYRSKRLPMGLVKAQRDYFDASGYDRVEQDGTFTTTWVPEHTRMKKSTEYREAREREWNARVEAAIAAGEEPPKKRRRRVRSMTGEMVLVDPD